ncbi:MAG: hypothetical protein AB7N65_04985 [Vicinamibacterales bacterium]
MPTFLRRAWRARLLLLLLLTGVLVAGCAARRFDRLMKDWEGRPLSQLLSTWGPPTTVYSDGTGGHVIVYVPAAATGATAGQPPSRTGPQLADEILHGLGARPVYAPRMSTTWPVYRLFTVDERGQVSGSRWKGDWVCCGM